MSLPDAVDFNTVSTVGLESSPVAAALAGLRANEARYFKNKYDHVFTVEPASNAKTTIDWVHRILKEERDIVISSRPLEATAFQVENIRMAYVFYESGLSINVMYTVDAPKKRAVGFKLSEGMDVPAELASQFKFARQKSKLAGTIRGSYFASRTSTDPGPSTSAAAWAKARALSERSVRSQTMAVSDDGGSSARIRSRWWLAPRGPAASGCVMSGVEAPALCQPARDELIERVLELPTGLSIDHPPRDEGVGVVRSLVVRRVDVHASEELGLVVVEHCVVERHVSGYLALMAGEILAVEFIRHVGGGPTPRRAIPSPQPFAGSHDGGVVDVNVALADRA